MADKKQVDFENDRFAGRGDDFYAQLTQAHDGLDHDESVRLNARLVLLLASQIGDIDVLEQVLKEAGATGGRRE